MLRPTESAAPNKWFPTCGGIVIHHLAEYTMMSATLMRTRSRLFALLCPTLSSQQQALAVPSFAFSVYCYCCIRSFIDSFAELNGFVYGVELVGREPCCWCLSPSVLRLCSAPTPNCHSLCCLSGESFTIAFLFVFILSFFCQGFSSVLFVAY